MYPKIAVVAALLASVEARFGQEQAVASVVSALSSFGQPGQAATLAGATPGVLLAGANACAKLQLADKIVSELGNNSQVISAAAKLVAAEKNFNPFAVSIPSLCSDPTLPATAELRGIVPLVDPAVTGSDVENANSAKSLQTPFNAAGLSVADVAKAQGFSNFTLQAADGSTAGNTAAAGNAAATTAASNNAATSAAAGAAATTTAAASNNNANKSGKNNGNNGNKGKGGKKGKGGHGKAGNSTVTATAAANNCAGVRTLTTVVVTSAAAATTADAAVAASTTSAAAAAASTTAAASNNNANASVQKSTIAGLDFGKCVPTMEFLGGLGNRPATEFTFQAIDPKISAIQQEALNPNIITNRICDELTNQCAANAAAKAACQQAKTQIAALTTRNKAVADQWNSILGFAGTTF